MPAAPPPRGRRWLAITCNPSRLSPSVDLNTRRPAVPAISGAAAVSAHAGTHVAVSRHLRRAVGLGLARRRKHHNFPFASCEVDVRRVTPFFAGNTVGVRVAQAADDAAVGVRVGGGGETPGSLSAGAQRCGVRLTPIRQLGQVAGDRCGLPGGVVEVERREPSARSIGTPADRPTTTGTVLARTLYQHRARASR